MNCLTVSLYKRDEITDSTLISVEQAGSLDWHTDGIQHVNEQALEVSVIFNSRQSQDMFPSLKSLKTDAGCHFIFSVQMYVSVC